MALRGNLAHCRCFWLLGMLLRYQGPRVLGGRYPVLLPNKAEQLREATATGRPGRRPDPELQICTMAIEAAAEVHKEAAAAGAAASFAVTGWTCTMCFFANPQPHSHQNPAAGVHSVLGVAVAAEWGTYGERGRALEGTASGAEAVAVAAQAGGSAQCADGQHRGCYL
jgi:hypothetical protein